MTARRVLRNLELIEVSAVDRPAQEGALIAIRKRHDAPGQEPGVCESRVGPGAKADEPAAVNKETPMTEPTAREAAYHKAAAEKAQALFKSVLSLSGAELDHFLRIKGDAARAEAFLSHGSVERDQLMKADEVVYKCDQGREYRLSDGPEVIAAVKARDVQAAETKRLQDQLAEAQLEKRAGDELANLAGDVTARKELLKAVDAINDEGARDAVLKALRSANDAAAGAFKSHGVAGDGGGAGDPARTKAAGAGDLAAIRKRSAELIQAHPGMKHADAFSQARRELEKEAA